MTDRGKRTLMVESSNWFHGIFQVQYGLPSFSCCCSKFLNLPISQTSRDRMFVSTSIGGVWSCIQRKVAVLLSLWWWSTIWNFFEFAKELCSEWKLFCSPAWSCVQILTDMLLWRWVQLLYFEFWAYFSLHTEDGFFTCSGELKNSPLVLLFSGYDKKKIWGSEVARGDPKGIEMKGGLYQDMIAGGTSAQELILVHRNSVFQEWEIDIAIDDVLTYDALPGLTRLLTIAYPPRQCLEEQKEILWGRWRSLSSGALL